MRAERADQLEGWEEQILWVTVRWVGELGEGGPVPAGGKDAIQKKKFGLISNMNLT